MIFTDSTLLSINMKIQFPKIVNIVDYSDTSFSKYIIVISYLKK